MLRPLEDMSRFPSRKARLKAVLVGEPSRRDLEQICDALNSKTREETVELRRLVAAWFASGPNLRKMLHSDFVVWRAVQNSWASRYLPTKTGRANIVLFPKGPPPDKESAEDEARLLFAALTLNPQCNLLAGPCARCGAYYIKKTQRQKVYCSQRCGSAATALPAVRKKRADEHARKITLARAVLSRWKPTSDEQSWKERVSKRTGLSVKWLSRAANRGEISPPTFVQSGRSV
jgi:hypothetical protein